jgi:phosphoribosylaminoimidazolecarboxamide formyltransferase/IMP cyclohydrolase
MQVAEPGAAPVRRALLSVYDKTGVVALAQGLRELGVELISTGGTARTLRDAGIELRTIEDFTGFPEIMDGRVKTLHPLLYGGLLARRDDPAHVHAAVAQGIVPIDLVCVNLYPFERTVARSGVSFQEAIENIDIGGPTMIRAAAKNHPYAAVLVEPAEYEEVLAELRASDGLLSLPTRRRLAATAFACTARYDASISRWFAGQTFEGFPPTRAVAYEKVMDLRYGENPHQRAAFYSEVGASTHLLAGVHQLHGKELSFNNLLDLSAARSLVEEIGATNADSGPSAGSAAAAIIKHNNPCGCAVAESASEAYERAFACDPQSAFGGVIAVNRRVDKALALALGEQFVEVLLAPGYDGDALALLTQKKNVRLLELAGWPAASVDTVAKPVLGGLLTQSPDVVTETRAQMQAVTAQKPTEQQWEDLLFAWRVCRHVRSNAIVLASERATIGVGAGQMSRVDSVRISVEKARASQPERLAGAALASDAFFPFADNIEVAAEAGVTSIIQPGGSVRDDEVIAAADAAGIAMVLTGVRHFLH